MAETIELTVGDVTTTALVGVPSGAGPFPGVVATFHREGLDDFTAWLIDDLNAHGYAAIAPNHYHALPQGVSIDRRREFLTDEQMSLDIKAAVDSLCAHETVDPGRLALLGHCMGGRTTWVGLVTYPELWRCGCVWYGGNSFNTMGEVPAPADRFDAIACPVAGHFGNDDGNPSPEDVDKLDVLLTELGKEHEFHRYDGAGHGFMSSSGPERYREAQAKDSWGQGLEFLARHLQP